MKKKVAYEQIYVIHMVRENIYHQYRSSIIY